MGRPPVVYGQDVASTSEMPVEMSKEVSAFAIPVNAASEASASGPVTVVATYTCHLPLNCYEGHGAVELDVMDINRGSSASACAEACNNDGRCAGFVYMGSQRKCWRRSQIWLGSCERGSWGQESSEFMTCVRPPVVYGQDVASTSEMPVEMSKASASALPVNAASEASASGPVA